MEKLYPSNKVRFRHLYDKTDKEEQILFYRCSLMVETYIKIHVRNQEDVYNSSNPQLSSSASFLRLNVLSSLN